MQEKDIDNPIDVNSEVPVETGNYSSIDINTDSDVPGTSHLNEPVNNQNESSSVISEITPAARLRTEDPKEAKATGGMR